MFHTKTLALASAAALLTGCASGGAKFNSRADLTDVGPIKRLVVYLNVKSSYFSGAVNDSFVASTRRRLEACGVSTSVVEYDSLELDMKKKLADQLAAVQPDAVVFITRDGGNLTNSGYGNVAGQLYFDVKALDKDGKKTFWTARINYYTTVNNMFVDYAKSGERFGAQFVSRMAQDGIVHDCPKDVANPEA
jgi:hypothetical protein